MLAPFKQGLVAPLAGSVLPPAEILASLELLLIDKHHHCTKVARVQFGGSLSLVRHLAAGVVRRIEDIRG